MLFEAKIGLEIHVMLKTESKLFCGCKNEFSTKPNTNTCPVCLGLAGALPKLNKQAVSLAIKAGLLLGSTIARKSGFDRKHYFYPDLPKAYQITQNSKPICIGGSIKLSSGKIVRINHIHLEEDAGKLIHFKDKDTSGIDFNRSGIPLLEIVTEADLSNVHETVEFLTKLKHTLDFGEISTCKMELGEMRADVNISVKPKDEITLGTKVEIKNLNSFKAVFGAVHFVTNRHIKLLDAGKKVISQTLRWNESSLKTEPLRDKADATDYRYMQDPNLKEIVLTQSDVEEIRDTIAQNREQRYQIYTKVYGINKDSANILLEEKQISDYFENCVKLYNNPQEICNWILTELLKTYKQQKLNTLSDIISEKDFCIIISHAANKSITRTVAKQLLEKTITQKINPEEAIKEDNLSKKVTKEEIIKLINALLKTNINIKEDYKKEPDKIINYIIGHIVDATSGKADIKTIKICIKEILK